MRRALHVQASAIAAFVVVLGGCAGSTDSSGAGTSSSTAAVATRSPADSRTCYAPMPGDTDAYQQTPCDDPSAEGYVLEEVHPLGLFAGEDILVCPDSFDFVLDVVASPPVKVTSSQNNTFACIRRLKPPHAADPGQGRAPLTVGDCVYPVDIPSPSPGVTWQPFNEIPCAEAGQHSPSYQVVRMGIEARIECPVPDYVRFQVGPFLPTGDAGDTTDACAKKL